MTSPGKGGGWAGTLVVALLLSLWLAGRVGASSGTPHALTCPSGETVWLRGTAAPGAALLVHFSGAPVGGGSAGVDGSWAIPITVRERPGVYPAVVTSRQDGATITPFTCYVDLALGATATTTPTTRATSAAATSSEIPATPVQQLFPSSTPPPPTTSPTWMAELAVPTPTVPIEPGATIAPEPSPEASPISPNTPAVAAVQPDDPEEPGLFEYVIVENQTKVPQTLVSWQLINRETGEAFAIPPLTISPGELLIVWSGNGQDEPDAGILYWPGTSPHWSPGQTVELHAPDGQIVSTLVVPDTNSPER